MKNHLKTCHYLRCENVVEFYLIYIQELTYIDISGRKVGIKALDYLGKCTQLQYLNIVGSFKLKKKEFDILKGIKFYLSKS